MIGNLLEIGLGDPSIPVFFEDLRRFSCSILAQSILVHNLAAIGLVECLEY